MTFLCVVMFLSGIAAFCMVRIGEVKFTGDLEQHQAVARSSLHLILATNVALILSGTALILGSAALAARNAGLL